MSTDERTKEEDLQNLACKKNTNENSKSLIILVRGPPWNQKIVKKQLIPPLRTNSDVFTKSKKQELESRLHQNPDIIVISEVKLKNFNRILTVSEYQLNSYSYVMETKYLFNEEGRGIIIMFIKNSLNYYLADLPVVDNNIAR